MLPLRALVEGDGAHYASLARDLLVGDFSGIANPYWSNLWPGVIAAVAFVTGFDVVEAGRAASLVAGALTALLAAHLGARLFGRATGLATGAAVAGHPWLVHFSTLVFTESLFALLLVAAVLAILRAERSPRILDSLWAGLVLAMALLTRPEALSVVAAGALFLLATGGGRRGVAKAAALVLVAGSFLGGRGVLTHHYYEEWDFGVQTKGTTNLLVGLADSDVERERVSSGITPEGENSLDAELRRWTLLRFTLAHPALVLGHVRRNLGAIASSARHVLPVGPVFLGRDAFTWPPVLGGLAAAATAGLLLAALGLTLGLARRESRGAALLIGAVLALYLLGLAPLFVHDRLIVALVPLSCLFLARGLTAVLVGGLGARWGPRATLLALAGAGALSLWGLVRSSVLDYSGDPPVQREAGLWLRDRFSQDLHLMTASASIPFYFYDARHQDNEISIPWASYEETLAYARKERADLVAAPEWHLQAAGYPSAPRLLGAQAAHPGLVWVGTVGATPPYRVFVYRVARGDAGR
jgi:hypothetical protein